MFIRQTTTGNSASNQSYFTYRLVNSVRIVKKVSQKTLLNLGRHFDFERELWPELCTRIDCTLDEKKINVVTIQWHFEPQTGSKATHHDV